MEQLKFSVAMSVYKNEKAEFFDRALESITDLQTRKPDEIVLVVDGPIGDDLNAVIDKYVQKYDIFNVLRLEQNGGLGNALKLATEKAKYPLIARMDTDDVSVENRFETQLAYFKTHPETSVLGGDITEFIGDEDNVVGKRDVPTTDAEIKEYAKKRCPFNHVAVMFQKEAVLSAGGYLEWHFNEDYYLWIRMQLAGAVFANTGSVLVNVRVGEDMYRRRGGRKYYKSEKRLQQYMRKHKMIGFGTYLSNVTKRFIVQVLLPNRLRGWVFKKFARKQA